MRSFPARVDVLKVWNYSRASECVACVALGTPRAAAQVTQGARAGFDATPRGKRPYSRPDDRPTTRRASTRWPARCVLPSESVGPLAHPSRLGCTSKSARDATAESATSAETSRRASGIYRSAWQRPDSCRRHACAPRILSWGIHYCMGYLFFANRPTLFSAEIIGNYCCILLHRRREFIDFYCAVLRSFQTDLFIS